jgi:hypothetical protein
MPSSLPLNPVFVFIDESGNFDFSEKGTRHFVMSAFVTADPLSSGARLQRLRYELLATGVDIAHFHASHDKQFIRDRVLAELAQLQDSWGLTLFLEKQRLSSSLRSKPGIFGLFAGQIASRLTELLGLNGFELIVFVFDKVLQGNEVSAFIAEMKPVFRKIKVRYEIYFHRVNFDYNGQIADYLAWSNFVKLERGEGRPVSSLADHLAHKFELEIK